MRILHLCWGLEPTNGAAQVARYTINEQRKAGHDVHLQSTFSRSDIASCDELWCHCGWYWRFWLAIPIARRLGKRIMWETDGCYDPIRLAYHGWKKRLAGPFERCALRQADTLIATCDDEAQWIREYVGKECPPVEVTDITRFFDLSRGETVSEPKRGGETNILYLGRPHPLKGLRYLEQAVLELNGGGNRYRLRMVSNHFGDELERDWDWCDIFCLPTLSDNFGLVVAEALSHGKRVVVTDGAPVWKAWALEHPSSRLTYVRGYRNATDFDRVELLKKAILSTQGGENLI